MSLWLEKLKIGDVFRKKLEKLENNGIFIEVGLVKLDFHLSLLNILINNDVYKRNTVSQK